MPDPTPDQIKQVQTNLTILLTEVNNPWTPPRPSPMRPRQRERPATTSGSGEPTLITSGPGGDEVSPSRRSGGIRGGSTGGVRRRPRSPGRPS